MFVGEILSSCGTDLEPEVFPNRTIENIETYPISGISTPDWCKRIFVSDTEVYYYDSNSSGSVETGGYQMVVLNLLTGESTNIPLIVEDDEELSYLLELLNRNVGEFGGSCWYEGKGYVVGRERSFVYAPETKTWSTVMNSYEDLGNYDYKETSNVLVYKNEMIQISSRRMYIYSFASNRWTSRPMTHDFMFEGSATLMSDGDNLYALNGREGVLFVYEDSSNLWKEKMTLYGNELNGGAVKIMIDGSLFYVLSDNSSLARQWDASNNTITLLKVSPLFSHPYYYYAGMENMFNIKSTGYILGYDGSMTYLMKFNLK